MLDVFFKGLQKPFDSKSTATNAEALAAYAIVLGIVNLVRK